MDRPLDLCTHVNHSPFIIAEDVPDLKIFRSTNPTKLDQIRPNSTKSSQNSTKSNQIRLNPTKFYQIRSKFNEHLAKFQERRGVREGKDRESEREREREIERERERPRTRSADNANSFKQVAKCPRTLANAPAAPRTQGGELARIHSELPQIGEVFQRCN